MAKIKLNKSDIDAAQPQVPPSLSHVGQHLTTREYLGGQRHSCTHGICYRSAIDLANSGIPVKVGIALTAA